VKQRLQLVRDELGNDASEDDEYRRDDEGQGYVEPR
jgi:hypothetical protein